MKDDKTDPNDRDDTPLAAPVIQSGIPSSPDASVLLNPHADLANLRHMFPFLPVMPFPPIIRCVALAANTPTDLEIPDGATVAMFFASGDFFLCREGNAQIPTTTNALAATCKSIFKPVGTLWYVRGVRSVSVISATADTVVSALCYATDKWPK